MKVLGLAAVVLAACKAPPVAPPDPEIARLGDALRALETARNELRLELMIVRFGQGAASFQGVEFEDRGFVEEILVKWQAVQAPLNELTCEQRRILAELPAAAKARYDRVPIAKEARFEASRALVAALMSRHDAIRKTAISALEAIYGRTLLYRHDAPAKHRVERHKKWVQEIHKQRHLPIVVPEPPGKRGR